MKRLLIVGASILQVPAIQRAKELGYYVGVVDYDNKAIGISYADEYFNVSTNDVIGITKTAKEFKADGIMTIGTDMPMRAIAKATSELGLPGISYDTAIKATDKGEMIKALKDYAVASPWYYIVENKEKLHTIAKKLTYPCIIKPTDNAGGRGVILVNRAKELKDAYKYSEAQSQDGTVIIEEYMEGQEVSVEVVCIDGEAHILAITDKLTTGPPYFVEIGHSQQSMLPGEDLVKIRKLTEQAVSAIGIKNGPAHVEIMLTSEGPKIIELGARMGGGFIASHLVPLSTGVDMIEATIRLACSQPADIVSKHQKGSAIRTIPFNLGRLVKIQGLKNATKREGIIDIIVAKKDGEILSELRNGSDRLGYVISQAGTAREAIQVCESAMNEIKVEICPCDNSKEKFE